MVITNFASGELSQNLKGRVDLGVYFSGCQKLKNFEIIPTGGIQRRTGFKKMGKLHGNSRLIPFIIDKDNSFILEFSSSEEGNFLYFWKNGKELLDEDDNQMKVEIPYTSMAEIREIQYAQNFDTMIFVQADHKPVQLTYYKVNPDTGSEGFKFGEMTFDYFIDANIDDDYGLIEICDTGLPVGKEGAYAYWQGHLYKFVTDKWEIQGNDPDVDTELFDKEGNYPSSVAFFQNRLFFGGSRNFRQRIWASAAPDTKGPRYNKFGFYQKYITVNKAIKEADIHLFTATILKSNIKDGKTVLTNVSQNFVDDIELKNPVTDYFVQNDTYVKAGTKVESLTANTVTLNREIPVIWEEGQTEIKGVVFTMSLWQSTDTATAEDYEYVVVNNNMTTSDCSFYLEPASDQNDAIKWLAPANYLCVGTESNVWNIPSGVNALNVAAVQNGRYGSDEIQAHVVDTAVIFFSQGKRGIREYYYNAQREDFQTNNIAIQAEQMLKESPAIDFDFCTNPYNRIIITREDGTAVTLLYDKNNGVMGWNRIEHGHGLLKSCAVTRGDSFSDLIYFSVYDGTDYWLEVLDASAEEEVYLDSWYSVVKEEGFNIDEYLEDEDQSWYEKDGVVYIGYEFESVILSLPVVTQDISSKKRIVNLYVRFNDSFLPVMKTTGLPDEFFNGIEEPYSGVRKIDYPGVSDIDVTFELAISKPEKCNILSVDASIA